MARYIDAYWIYEKVENRYRVSSGIEHRCERDLLDLICQAPTADVVPKSEVERLEREVRLLTENTITAKYSHCVIGSYYAVLTKSLEDYEKVIADISSAAKAEVAREIFEEIEKKSCVISETNHSTDYTRVVCYQISAGKFAELKKKYTEGE